MVICCYDYFLDLYLFTPSMRACAMLKRVRAVVFGSIFDFFLRHIHVHVRMYIQRTCTVRVHVRDLLSHSNLISFLPLPFPFVDYRKPSGFTECKAGK